MMEAHSAIAVVGRDQAPGCGRLEPAVARRYSSDGWDAFGKRGDKPLTRSGNYAALPDEAAHEPRRAPHRKQSLRPVSRPARSERFRCGHRRSGLSCWVISWGERCSIGIPVLPSVPVKSMVEYGKAT